MDKPNLLRVSQKVDISNIIEGVKGHMTFTCPSLRSIISVELRISEIKAKMDSAKDGLQAEAIADELLNEFESFFNKYISEIKVETAEGLQSADIADIMDLSITTITAFWAVVKEGTSPKAPQA